MGGRAGVRYVMNKFSRIHDLLFFYFSFLSMVHCYACLARTRAPLEAEASLLALAKSTYYKYRK